MPEHPVLRQVAEEMERFDRIAQMVDRDWRFVYVSSEMWRGATGGRMIPEVYEMGHVRRELEVDFPSQSQESARAWWRLNAPYMRHSLEPGTPEFANAFGPNAERAAAIEPKPPPPVWGIESFFKTPEMAVGAQHLVSFRIDDLDGAMVGVLEVSWPPLSGQITALLSRGDTAMFERMARMAEPHRCPTAILFCDIEASGELSRTLSSKAYFELIRSVTTAFDEAVIEGEGIVGLHAGDGANAFFCPPDHRDSVSKSVAAAITAARKTRDLVGELESAPAVNFGIHWGETVMMGQIATGGRLEVTAIGDEVNEAARIQDAATGGTILASKDLIERLAPVDAAELGIDTDLISYRPLGRLEGVSEKALRDAATIPVTEI